MNRIPQDALAFWGIFYVRHDIMDGCIDTLFWKTLMPSLARRSFLLSSLALALTTTGCGFRLRGQFSLPFETMYVNMPRNNRMAASIRRMLASGTNVQLVDAADDAQAILDFMGQNRYREVIALNTKGEAREFELTLKLTFRVVSPDGDEYFPATTFTASREITYNEEDYNSRDAEEALLYNEMQEELIIQLLNRLSTIKPHIHAY